MASLTSPPAGTRTDHHVVDSDIVYMNLAGTHVVILNSAEHISEILDKRSAISSNRCALVL